MSEIVDRIVGKFGSQTALAAALNTKQSTVAQWKRRGSIPWRQQLRILEEARKRQINISPDDFFPTEVL